MLSNKTYSLIGKKTLFLLLLLCFLLSKPYSAVAANILPLYLEGDPSGYNAVALNGHWYVGLRDACNIYCVNMHYDNATKTITIYNDPTPTVLQINGQQIQGDADTLLQNGVVYVRLTSLPMAADLYTVQSAGKAELSRRFCCQQGKWYWRTQDNQWQPLSEHIGFQQVGDYGYLSLAAKDTMGSARVWQFGPNGKARVVAKNWLGIDSFAVADNCVYIVGRDTWNACSVIKFDLADGSKTELGEPNYDYGDNLHWADLDGVALLPQTGIAVRDDGVYTVGYSRKGFLENNLIDKAVFADSYGYYRLDKNGGVHERVENWPQ